MQEVRIYAVAKKDETAFVKATKKGQAMFDEEPDGDPHGECAEEIANLQHLLGLCYAKLLKFGVENSDPLLMDELKLELTK